MRLLVVVLVLIIGLIVFQAERFNCYWHGIDQVMQWASCLIGD
jgi:hypothetical protein